MQPLGRDGDGRQHGHHQQNGLGNRRHIRFDTMFTVSARTVTLKKNDNTP